MSKDVYLVVGCGFLGRHIVERLQARGDDVSIFDLEQRMEGISYYQGDISNEAQVLDALKQSSATCVFHTASPHATTAKRDVLHRVNVEGTKVLISASQKVGVSKLVFTGSSGVVFNGKDVDGVDEACPYAVPQLGEYSATKVAAEKAVLAANGKDGLLTCVLRPSGLFGPGDRQTIPHMYRAYLEGKTNLQFGNNKNLTDWTYITNAADAHLLAADKLVEGHSPPIAGEIFFITNDEPYPFWDFSHGIWNRMDKYHPGKRSGKPPTVIPRSIGLLIAGAFEVVRWILRKKEKPVFTRYVVTFMCTSRWYDINKAKTVLGYAPAIGMEEGMDRTIEWWMSEVKKEK